MNRRTFIKLAGMSTIIPYVPSFGENQNIKNEWLKFTEKFPNIGDFIIIKNKPEFNSYELTAYYIGKIKEIRK